MTRARMIGLTCMNGPGGRDCPCCGQAPGTERKRARRHAKRSERNAWRRDVAKAEWIEWVPWDTDSRPSMDCEFFDTSY